MLVMFGRFLLAAAGMLLSSAALAHAGSVSIPFQRITSNSPIGASLASQFEVAVSDVTRAGGSLASDEIRFSFRNVVGLASSITRIFFDDADGVFDRVKAANGSAGVSFTAGTSGTQLPGGGSGFTTDFAAKASKQGGPPNNGLNEASDWLDVIFELDDDFDGVNRLANVAEALRTGGLRIGMHVTALSDGGSEAFLSTPPGNTPPVPTPVVPVPPAALAGAGLLGLVGLARARRRD
jgi:hypothetical protein